MAHKWKAIAKHGLITVGEVGVIATSTILTKKFLDARVIFAKQIAANPAYADKFYIKHQGAVKLTAGVIAASMIKNPWLKMVCIGVALEGFITEARLLTTNKDGVSIFDQIGADESTEGVDEEMMEAAKRTSGFGDRFSTTVGGPENFGNRYDTSVAGWGNESWNPMNPNPRISTVTGVA